MVAVTFGDLSPERKKKEKSDFKMITAIILTESSLLELL